MRVLLLTIVLLMSSFAICAQSHSKEDYVMVFTNNGVPHYVDTTSLETLRNGNLVFWAMSPYRKDVLSFVSLEANCTYKKLRMRSVMFSYGEETKVVPGVTPWFPKTDQISNAYVAAVCGVKTFSAEN